MFLSSRFHGNAWVARNSVLLFSKIRECPEHLYNPKIHNKAVRVLSCMRPRVICISQSDFESSSSSLTFPVPRLSLGCVRAYRTYRGTLFRTVDREWLEIEIMPFTWWNALTCVRTSRCVTVHHRQRITKVYSLQYPILSRILTLVVHLLQIHLNMQRTIYLNAIKLHEREVYKLPVFFLTHATYINTIINKQIAGLYRDKRLNFASNADDFMSTWSAYSCRCRSDNCAR